MPDYTKNKIKYLDRSNAVGGAMAFLMLFFRYGFPDVAVPRLILFLWAALFPIGLFLEALLRLLWIKDPWHYIYRHPLRYIILLMIVLEMSGVATWSQSHTAGDISISVVVGELYMTIAMFGFIGSWAKGGVAANRWLANRRLPVLLLPALSFGAFIIAGTLLLSLPGFHRYHVAPIDILFTVTSAVCVTGLTVLNLPTAFSSSGQTMVALLIQLGGLGTMTTLGMLALWQGGQLSLGERVAFTELVGGRHLWQTRNLVTTIATVTITIELLGAITLGLLWRDRIPHAILQGIFHAISAFCNAGFSLFQDGFVSFQRDRLSLITIMVLIVLGGLGFTVVADLYQSMMSRLLPWMPAHPLRKATRVVLTWTCALIVLGAAIFWLDGYFHQHSRTVFASLFQSITCRTAGFQIESQLNFGQIGFLGALILMTIGASPQSTGGGVRTAVVARLFSKIDPVDPGEGSKKLFNFKPFRIALLCLLCYVGIAAIGTVILMSVEPLSFTDSSFEAFSALGTVGLSHDVTPTLNSAGKFLIIALMFTGRVLFPTLVIRLVRSRRESPDPVEWV